MTPKEADCSYFQDQTRNITAPPTPGHNCQIVLPYHASTAHGSHKKEIVLAQVSLVMVLMFILCHSIKWIPNIYELLQVCKLLRAVAEMFSSHLSIQFHTFYMHPQTQLWWLGGSVLTS